MIHITKENSRKFLPFKAVLLLLVLSFFMVGFTNETESLSSMQDVENRQILIGAIDVKGKGVSIKLTDTLSVEQKNRELNSTDMQNRIVHDIDLIKTVNILRNAGAEVISINDERLLPISKIQGNEEGIEINNNKYDSSSYTIKAIGNPEALINALNEKDSYIQTLKNFLNLEIEEKDEILIPKYKDTIYFKYAQPVKK